jgi:hypothetical protein
MKKFLALQQFVNRAASSFAAGTGEEGTAEEGTAPQ